MAMLLQITNAGLDAIVVAEGGGTDAVTITELGLTETAFAQSPTLTALPGEFKRLDAVSGDPVSPTVIHMTAYDTSDAVYAARGFGLYLDDGTLFATYVQANPVLSKAALAFGLFAFDISFSNDISAVITFGDSVFLYPPATRTVKGVARLATPEQVEAGLDDETIVTPAQLKVVLDALYLLLDGVDDGLASALSALLARTITGGGLATGGGDLTASRTISVAAASAAEVRTGTRADAAITPAALGPIVKSLGLNGYASIPGADPANTVLIQWGRFMASPNGGTAVTFPIAFADANVSVQAGGTSDTSDGIEQNWPAVRSATITDTGFSVQTCADTSQACCFLAIGRIDLT